MDTACLQHRLTADERRQFEEHGCFVVRNALPPELVARLVDAVDRLEAEHRPLRDLGPAQPFNHLDCIGYDDAFLKLLEWPDEDVPLKAWLAEHLGEGAVVP